MNVPPEKRHKQHRSRSRRPIIIKEPCPDGLKTWRTPAGRRKGKEEGWGRKKMGFGTKHPQEKSNEREATQREWSFQVSNIRNCPTKKLQKIGRTKKNEIVGGQHREKSVKVSKLQGGEYKKSGPLGKKKPERRKIRGRLVSNGIGFPSQAKKGREKGTVGIIKKIHIEGTRGEERGLGVFRTGLRGKQRKRRLGARQEMAKKGQGSKKKKRTTEGTVQKKGEGPNGQPRNQSKSD